MEVSLSRREDIPRLRELWFLAFGDDGAYVDNFFSSYYRPETMIVLEEEGTVQSMTAWFDTRLVLPEGEELRAAYLYAVGTHPQCRGRGLAGQMLAGADQFFRSWEIPAVTTVPASPSLHNFFAANGFQECFTHSQLHTRPGPVPQGTPPFSLDRLTPQVYQGLREAILAGTPHIALDQRALAYQAGACALTSGGGLYAADTGAGAAILCAEGMEDGSLLVKELLGIPEATAALLPWLPALLPRWSGIWRQPGDEVPFGMVKWLTPDPPAVTQAYLGLAFD